MSNLRLLITGASGLLGTNLVQMLKDDFYIIPTFYKNPPRTNKFPVVLMNMTKMHEVQKVFNQFSPQIVIHCAAETRVDYCEEHPEHAYQSNVVGTENLAKSSAAFKAKFIYISTDSVFDGKHENYQESASPNPLNIYAQTKLKGEKVAQAYSNDHLIIRTNIYGWNARSKTSLAEWVLDRLDHGQVVPGFTDIYFAPLLVNDLAKLLMQSIETRLHGLYHLASADSCSKFEFAKLIAQLFNKDASLVQKSNSDAVTFKAKRPKNTSLDASKISEDLGRSMPNIRESLQYFKALLENHYVDELRSDFV